MAASLPEPASLATVPSYPASSSVASAQPESVPVATRVAQPTNSGDANQNSKPGERTLENSNAHATSSLIPPSKGSSSETALFYVNIGAFAIAENASKAYKTVSDANITAFTQDVETPKGKLTRVRAGPYATRAQADAVAKKTVLLGLGAVIVRE
jgi:DedD protein